MKKLLFLLLIFLPCFALADVTVGPCKQYESFTQAIYETVDDKTDVVVYPGVYDIKKEYQDYFKIKDLCPDKDLGHMFQYGIYLHDRKVTFLPGAKLVCVWQLPYDYSIRFSPLYTAQNTILEGLDLYAEGTMYGIHDDVWRYDEPYVNEFRYCRIIGRYLFGGNCLGGGVTKNTRVIIDNCYFDNGASGSATVRYHNTDYENAEGDIWISDSYFNAYFAACYYGTTSHLNVYVNGSRAEKIETRKETEDSIVQNIDLYKWNNE